MNTEEKKSSLLNEIRYAERLTQRTARLYRRLDTLCTFVAVVGGSGALASVVKGFPVELSVVGASVAIVAGALALTVRPLEKALTNDVESRKYAALRTAGAALDTESLQLALNKAREGDAEEVEALRDVAYNDVMQEIGREDLKTTLGYRQRLIGALA